MGNASDTEVWTQRDGLSIDCEQLVILIQKEEDWPALDSELDEIQAVSKEFSEHSIAYIPRSLKFRTNSLAKGVRSRASRLAFVNSFAPSWLASQASMRVPKKRIKLKVKLNIPMNKFIRSPYLCGCLYGTNNCFQIIIEYSHENQS